MAKIVPINQAEAIFEPFFDYNLSDIKELQLIEMGGKDGVVRNDWSSCCISSKAKSFKVIWNGKLEIEGYDSMRFFIQYSKNLRLTGRATINDNTVSLFEDVEPDAAPIEPTGYIGSDYEKLVLTSYELEFINLNAEKVNGEVTLYWSGLLASKKEHLIEEALPKYSSEWKGLINYSEIASVRSNIFFTEKELLVVKRMLQLDENKGLLNSLISKAKKLEGFVPENEIREYLATEEHMYRFVRVRDRNRKPLEESVTDLAIAGWLTDNKEWSLLAARMVLSIVYTPKWFEGPVCCLEGSDFHHVCFTEDHYLSAVVVATGFLGDILTDEAIKIIMDKVEEAWKWVDFKCSERGYRHFMNQGIVGSRGQMIGAYALWFYSGKKYQGKIEKCYRNHTSIVNNYLNEEGHCPEGPHYFDYSFSSSVYLWILYAKFKGLDIVDILPDNFKKSVDYIDLLQTSQNDGRECLKLNCGRGRISLFLSTFMQRFCVQKYCQANDKNRIVDYLNNEIPILDIMCLLLWKNDSTNALKSVEKVNYMEKSGLAAYSFDKGLKGKFWLTCERNPLTGHYHEDRGAIALEVFGEFILPDLGTTSYSNISSKYMHLNKYHNVAYPENVTPRISSKVGDIEAAKAGHNIDSELTMEMLDVPEARIEYFKETALGVEFKVDLSPIYDCAKTAIRTGNLNAFEDEVEINIIDHWRLDTFNNLCVNFISYYPWQIGDKNSKSYSDKFTMDISFDCDSLFSIEQDDFMVDFSSKKVYVLRVKVANSKEPCLKSKVRIIKMANGVKLGH